MRVVAVRVASFSFIFIYRKIRITKILVSIWSKGLKISKTYTKIVPVLFEHRSESYSFLIKPHFD